MDDKPWAEAFVAYGLDAAVGRHFRGVTHNLNGVAQAFSLQAELLGMFFARTGELSLRLEKAATLTEARELGRELSSTLARRATLPANLEKQALIMRGIMARVSAMVEKGREGAAGGACSLEEIVAAEVEFMSADTFFKHKVKKELELAADLPAIGRHRLEISQIVGVLLENAAQALAGPGERKGEESATVRITGAASPTGLRLQVTDNGPGVPDEDRERIFLPFYTTRPGRLGLGLFLARCLAQRCHGSLKCEALSGQTAFTLVLPAEETAHGQ